MGNPTYVTLTSSGTSSWVSLNYQVAPFNVGLAVRTTSLSSAWQIDVTMDDPFGTFPPPTGSSSPTVFQSSQVNGPSAGSTNAIGGITIPIAAVRLTTNSTGGTVTLTVLQSGIG